MQLTTCSKPAVQNLLQVCSSQFAASLQFTICSKSAVHNLQQVCSSQFAPSLPFATCSKSAVRNLQQACWQLAADLLSSSRSKRCERILISAWWSQLAASLQQTCCNLRVSGCVTGLRRISDLLQGCPIQSFCIKIFKTLTTQGWRNILSWLYHTCWNNQAWSVTTIWDTQYEHNLSTACKRTCCNLFAGLWQLVRFYVCILLKWVRPVHACGRPVQEWPFLLIFEWEFCHLKAFPRHRVRACFQAWIISNRNTVTKPRDLKSCSWKWAWLDVAKRRVWACAVSIIQYFQYKIYHLVMLISEGMTRSRNAWSQALHTKFTRKCYVCC